MSDKYYVNELNRLLDKELKTPGATRALEVLREMELTLILNLETFMRTPVNPEDKIRAEARKNAAQMKIDAIRAEIKSLEGLMTEHNANVAKFLEV